MIERQRLIVLGSVNIDLVIRGPRLPKPGETVLGGEFYRAEGGKGANQAVAAARCARQPVLFVAAIGDDDFGQAAREQLQREHLNDSLLKVVPGESTGVALILVDERGENLISVASGANLRLSPDDVNAIDESHFASSSVFLACLESPWETVVAGLRRARSAGLFTIVNPAPADERIVTADALPLIDLLTPNESELEALTGQPLSNTEAVIAAGRWLQQRGCRRVLVTRGSAGCLLLDGEDVVRFPSLPVKAVDTTAAGDAFNGVLAVALSEGAPLREACRWGTVAGGLSVTRRGAQPSLPDRSEVLQNRSHLPAEA